MRTICVHADAPAAAAVATTRARAEILNQCFKAFRLFIHNLTLTTAMDVRCIFREDKRAGAGKC